MDKSARAHRLRFPRQGPITPRTLVDVHTLFLPWFSGFPLAARPPLGFHAFIVAQFVLPGVNGFLGVPGAQEFPRGSMGFQEVPMFA
eukprot:8553595-Pyramimonas_sp.AAC.1